MMWLVSGEDPTFMFGRVVDERIHHSSSWWEEVGQGMMHSQRALRLILSMGDGNSMVRVRWVGRGECKILSRDFIFAG
jgi:hypothetical protein